MIEAPNTIAIRFVTSDDIISAIIREKTWCQYSHCEFLLDDGTTLGAHAEGGVKIRPANYAVFTAIKIIRFPVTVEQKAGVLDSATAQIGKPYDMGAIFGIEIHRDWRNPKKWFCSELVTAALESGKVIKPIATNIDRIVPRDNLVLLTAMFGDA
jgi:uncharacterized protein YycO